MTPATGREVLDDFTVKCTRWMDEDLPLLYQFGFSVPPRSKVAPP